MYVIAVYDNPQFDKEGRKILLEKVTCQFVKELKRKKQYLEERYPDKIIIVKKRYREGWKEISI